MSYCRLINFSTINTGGFLVMKLLNKLNTIGLITYHYPHLKTEQVLQHLTTMPFKYKIFALPFLSRKQRTILTPHRPEQTDAVVPEILAQKHKIPYIKCENDTDIDNSCDMYLILGAGIISAQCIKGKRIINCHPGIIPAVRGLDSFKWAIYEMKPLGITLHYIDAETDAGEVISIIPTNVYKTDSLSTLARRHYENEIHCLSNFLWYMQHPANKYKDIKRDESKKRMSIEIETEMVRRFTRYIERFGE
jgi:phosphoribosylglycinamide formyltransferase-1